jgi:beta-lactamase class D
MRLTTTIVLAWTLMSLPVAAAAKPLCTVFADAASGKILKQEGTCDVRVTAASTFKIALSLMGYDSGYLVDEHLPALPFHEGYPVWNPTWKATTDPASWIRNSVVWFSQQITEWLGEARLQHYVTEFRYGNQDLSGNPGKHDGLTHAWLSSSLKISPLEQVQFLERVVNRRLLLSPYAYDMTSRILALGALPNGWQVYGKTGTGSPIREDASEDLDHSYGWFVGWTVNGGQTVLFARLAQDDQRTPVNAGLRVRDGFLQQLPTMLETLGK